MSLIPDLDAIHRAVHAVLQSWISKSEHPATLLDDFLLVKENPAGTPGGKAADGVVLAALDILGQQDKAAAKLLRWRFIDNETRERVANRVNTSSHTVSRHQYNAIGQLALIVQAQETALREERRAKIEAHLPPSTYSRLFGTAEMLQMLKDSLLGEDDPAVVVVVGIGGIGKSSLADAITRQIIKHFHFDGIHWLRFEALTMSGEALSHELVLDWLLGTLAKRLDIQPLPVTPEDRLARVRQRLKADRHFVVVDNLERTADTEFLLQQLSGLAGPSKFLLTSRSNPRSQTAARRFVLPELSEDSAVNLMRHHAAELGITALAEADQTPLQQIYSVTGGNPLALKLVVSLLDLLPLSQILEDLAQSRSGPIEGLYRHIYRQNWQTLSQPARDLLQAMPLVAEAGGAPDYLQAISGLEGDTFWGALHELHARSLLEVRGTLDEKRYGIHRLTETFVRQEIVGWPESDQA